MRVTLPPWSSRPLAVFLALLACLLSPAASAAGRAPADPDGRSLAFVGVDVIPMAGRRALLRDQTVVVRDGRIAAVGPRRRVPIPAGAVRIDGAGRYLMPGLADMHAHLEHFDNPTYLQLFLIYGVTAVRSMDGRPNVLEWRRQAEAGTLESPSIYTAGQVIDGDPPIRDDNRVVRNAEEARAAVEEHAGQGYDFIKVYARLSPEAFRAIVATARERGLPVAGHVPQAVTLDEALAAPMVSIEHVGDFADAIEAGEAASRASTSARRRLMLQADPAKMDALAARLKASGVWVAPTLITYDRGVARPEVLQQWLADPAMAVIDRGVLQYYWQAGVTRAGQALDAEGWKLVDQARANRIALLGAFRRAGVRLLVGTDTPQPFCVPGLSVHDELENFVAAGFTPHQALTIATRDAARFMGQGDAWGTVEPGKRADLLLLEADPLQDIRATRRIAGVVRQGRWHPAARLEEMRKAVEAIAAASD